MTARLIPLQITVTSDTICPFCFLGLRKLEKALSTSPLTSSSGPSSSAIFLPSVRFLPFQLDPTLPTSHGLNKREAYRKKFGAERVAGMEEMMKRNGEPYSIKFNYDGDIRNTTSSHRLMELAFHKGGWEKQLSLLNTLFPHYFEKAGDPGDINQLTKIGIQAGIFENEKEADEFFSSSQYQEEVQKAFILARQKGISGVPHFEIIAGDLQQDSIQKVKAEIPGAQEPDTFLAVFKQISEAYSKANGVDASQQANNVVSDIPQGSKC
ncbi:unnamed protein product [Sympodiomycopsis kandeliae]